MEGETPPSTTPNSDCANNVPESPKPLAFTIDFGNGKTFDSQRRKNLMDKFQKKHRRGQSLSKIEDNTAGAKPANAPLTGNLPRKSSFQSEGYFSSDEKPEHRTVKTRGGNNVKRTELILQLQNVTWDRMTQSVPNSGTLASINSPVELRDVSSPELDLISPYSPSVPKLSSPESEELFDNDTTVEEHVNEFVDGGEFDFDKSDTVSDTGTYTLDADNYSEEQKERMSIDRHFKIEAALSLEKKTEEYVRNLAQPKYSGMLDINQDSPVKVRNSPPVHKAKVKNCEEVLKMLNLNDDSTPMKSPTVRNKGLNHSTPQMKSIPIGKVLSPILSPTQNVSITDTTTGNKSNYDEGEHNKTFRKIIFPSPRAKQDGLDKTKDEGSVISVTSSGAFRSKNEKEKKHERKYSLTKSEIQVQAYIGEEGDKNGVESNDVMEIKRSTAPPKLTANIVNVQNIEVKHQNVPSEGIVSESLVFGKFSSNVGLPPTGFSGKVSPSKIPSPLHTLSRPRSRNSISGLNLDLSDNALDNTEMILKPTQNCINSLQQRLSLESDADSDFDNKYGLKLNNTAHLLKQKASHTRHNSLDDTGTMNNKLEHFQNKNLQGIDQTYSNVFNQYSQNRVIHKIQNSPNNSPIKRSSSFSTTKNQINAAATKNTNIFQKEINLCSSPSAQRNISIQRSSSTACIKPAYITNRPSIIVDHQKQFCGDTESSSEEDFDKNVQKRKDLANISYTRCNRAFSLRRARLDEPPLKCPNTPEMRRKYQPEMKMERAISVDRKPMKTNEVQSRYLQNISKRGTPSPVKTDVKIVPKTNSATKSNSNKMQQQTTFSRTDSGRFSMRGSSKPPVSNAGKSFKKDGSGKKTGGARSNSSLSSREVEFQNWKRRKSYDPMKAAAEGKKKELAKRQNPNIMTQSYTESNHSQDSSPSHSSSVHRSQSFHGTAALEHQLISSEEDDDLTLSADEGFSPPTPSPCELSPARATLRHTLWERIHH